MRWARQKFYNILFEQMGKKIGLVEEDKKNINKLVDHADDRFFYCLYMGRHHVLGYNISDLYRKNYKNYFSKGILNAFTVNFYNTSIQNKVINMIVECCARFEIPGFKTNEERNNYNFGLECVSAINNINRCPNFNTKDEPIEFGKVLTHNYTSDTTQYYKNLAITQRRQDDAQMTILQAEKDLQNPDLSNDEKENIISGMEKAKNMLNETKKIQYTIEGNALVHKDFIQDGNIMSSPVYFNQEKSISDEERSHCIRDVYGYLSQKIKENPGVLIPILYYKNQ